MIHDTVRSSLYNNYMAEANSASNLQQLVHDSRPHSVLHSFIVMIILCLSAKTSIFITIRFERDNNNACSAVFELAGEKFNLTTLTL